MEPNKFRESRQAINRLCENINLLIAQKDLETSKISFEEVSTNLDKLTPKAEGEIQERSVKNLSVKLRGLSMAISKLKPKKRPKKKSGEKVIKIPIVWDEDRLEQLSPVFLQKVFANMENDTEAKVCFDTTGKGIRPGYRIELSNKDKTTFSGSGHRPLKKPPLAGTKKMSQPFPHKIIDSILKGKKNNHNKLSVQQ